MSGLDIGGAQGLSGALNRMRLLGDSPPAGGEGPSTAPTSGFGDALYDALGRVNQLQQDVRSKAEGIMTGTHDGVFHTPNGDVAPTGRAVELRWAAVYLTEGDTLKSEHLFFDQMDFLGQLGLVPD